MIKMNYNYVCVGGGGVCICVYICMPICNVRNV